MESSTMTKMPLYVLQNKTATRTVTLIVRPQCTTQLQASFQEGPHVNKALGDGSGPGLALLATSGC